MNDAVGGAVSVPLVGLLTSAAVSASPSGSVSLPRSRAAGDGQGAPRGGGGVVVGDRGVVDGAVTVIVTVAGVPGAVAVGDGVGEGVGAGEVGGGGVGERPVGGRAAGCRWRAG